MSRCRRSTNWSRADVPRAAVTCLRQLITSERQTLHAEAVKAIDHSDLERVRRKVMASREPQPMAATPRAHLRTRTAAGRASSRTASRRHRQCGRHLPARSAARSPHRRRRSCAMPSRWCVQAPRSLDRPRRHAIVAKYRRTARGVETGAGSPRPHARPGGADRPHARRAGHRAGARISSSLATSISSCDGWKWSAVCYTAITWRRVRSCSRSATASKSTASRARVAHRRRDDRGHEA